jgi:glycosyltransferase involved in cell wall biosynthesis
MTRILVDATILHPALGGIATYARKLLEPLSHESQLVVATGCVPELPPGGRFEVIAVTDPVESFVRRAAWRERHLGRLARYVGADVVFAIAPELPLRGLATPSVIVVHDVIPLEVPALEGWSRWLRYRAALPRIVRSADRVVTVSAATLLSLHKLVGVDLGKCRIVHEGGPEPRPSTALRDPRHVLYVGSLLGRKNVETLADAVACAPGLPPLRLAGPLPPHHRDRLASWTEKAGQGRVTHHGFVSDDELDALYAGATALAVPSLAEGFGLPMLEAMARSVPVVASDLPVVREVVGDAALLVTDPLNPREWAEKLSRAAEPAVRASLIEAGLRRLERFSWPAAAAATLEVLDEAARSRA